MLYEEEVEAQAPCLRQGSPSSSATLEKQTELEAAVVAEEKILRM